MELVEGRNVVVRATNAQGMADSAFLITVVDMLLDYAVSLDGLTANPTHGQSAETGVPLTVTASGPSPGSAAEPVAFWFALPSSLADNKSKWNCIMSASPSRH